MKAPPICYCLHLFIVLWSCQKAIGLRYDNTGCPNKNAPLAHCSSRLLGHFYWYTLYNMQFPLIISNQFLYYIAQSKVMSDVCADIQFIYQMD